MIISNGMIGTSEIRRNTSEAIDGLAGLEQELNALDSALSDLHARISMVLAPPSPKDTVGAEKVSRDPESTLGNLIGDRVRQTRCLIEVIRDFTDRVRI